MQKFAKFIILVLVCFLFLGLGCKKQEETAPTEVTQPENTTPKNVLDLDGAEALSTSKKNLITAKSTTKYWSGNTRFVALNIQVGENLSIIDTSQVFIFYSPGNHPIQKYYYWMASFNNEGKYLRGMLHKEDYLKDLGTNPKAIVLSKWKNSWVDALKKAELAGGKEFQTKHENDTKISMSLRTDIATNSLIWQINYQQLSAQDSLDIIVDAETGEASGETTSGTTENQESVETPTAEETTTAE